MHIAIKAPKVIGSVISVTIADLPTSLALPFLAQMMMSFFSTNSFSLISLVTLTISSNTILPSITRRSLMYVAKEYLGLEVEEREVYLTELSDFAECGLCGTAAVISPVGKIVDHGKEICFPSGMQEMGPVSRKLYETLTGIQYGKIKAPDGWIKTIV